MKQPHSSPTSLLAMATILVTLPAWAQKYPPPEPPPPQMQPAQPPQLDQLVQRIALYPDPLLAQVLTASTFWDQIPEAAAWAAEHGNLNGPALSQAITEDRLPWDPSVLGLLPLPNVLSTMAQDPGWTQALGTAVLGNRASVMDAIQRQRQVAMQYGYLQSNAEVQVVGGPGDIEILPAEPNVVYVPMYDPYVVFAAPRPGFFVGGAIRFGPRFTISAGFLPFGWVGAGLGWRDHAIIVDHHPWVRTWDNRERYVHPYEHPVPRFAGPRVERHDRRH
jgi:hypothetical protein